ncbi:MAG: pilus (MSHA type) biogenesis protein MshL [Campylobacterota bacterium]|nr:pilus (MSHA type) biogenesis protein MshL [Campylobacterota bacterium]
MKLNNKSIYAVALTLLLSGSSFADCSYELFSISSTKDTKIIDFVEQLSDECEFSIIVSDSKTEEFLNSKLNKTHLKNLTIDEVLNIVLKENNLSYELENNLLKISYLTTRVFPIDYILSQRRGSGSTDVTLSSSSDAKTSETTTTDDGASSAESGIKIESSDEVKFWEELDLELQRVLNRPSDIYVAQEPIINKNAGLITVTATNKQMKRLEDYLKKLQDKVQLQVLIDVQLLTVTMNEGRSTGIDWSQLYALQNLELSVDYVSQNNVAEREGNKMTKIGEQAKNAANLVSISGGGSLNEVIKFLQTQGDVNSISNPKVLTLNNQPALITAGTEYFYKIKGSETLAGGSTGKTSEEEEIKSVFAGVLLDITPEISDDNTITLKINPSLSETRSDMTQEVSPDGRTMPPDLSRRQLSSVVTVKDGERIILGGLINTRSTLESNQIPILGDIPILSYLFKYEEKVKQVQELVIVIEPHIIKKDGNNLSLKELGYEGLTDAIVGIGNNSKVKQNNQKKVAIDKEATEVKEADEI